jgi:hypothetical protein
MFAVVSRPRIILDLELGGAAIVRELVENGGPSARMIPG